MSTLIKILVNLPADDLEGVAAALSAAAVTYREYTDVEVLEVIQDPTAEYYGKTSVWLTPPVPSITYMSTEHFPNETQ